MVALTGGWGAKRWVLAAAIHLSRSPPFNTIQHHSTIRPITASSLGRDDNFVSAVGRVVNVHGPLLASHQPMFDEPL